MATTQEMIPGRWYETEKTNPTQWIAVCGKCGAIKAAVELENKRLPFGRGERWQCKGGC